MKEIHIVGILCLAIIGCYSSSIHPILTDKDLVHDLDLSGSWRQLDLKEKDGPLYEFTLAGYDGNGRYDMTLLNFTEEERSRSKREQEGGKSIPAEYDVAIGKLGEMRFLQVRRSESNTGGPSFFEGVVTHTFAKFELKNDVLFAYPIDDVALEKLLPKTKMAHLTHKPSDLAPNIVITESTPRMQEFLQQHHQTMFRTESIKFRRLPVKRDEQSHPPKPTR